MCDYIWLKHFKNYQKFIVLCDCIWLKYTKVIVLIKYYHIVELHLVKTIQIKCANKILSYCATAFG